MPNPQNPDDPQAPPPSGGGIQLPLGDRKNITPINIEDEMRRSYLDYSMSVIIGRALPDVRDGLKPVHRRILFGMSEMGLTYNRPTKKCARIVGDVLGKFHPHGDTSVYDALVRMAQPFSMRYPLVDGQGNFGSVDADPPAAMRYTEARLSKIAAVILEDLDKETVDFRSNYDDTMQEPEVLPTRVPNLLLNGSEGIAVGMATRIPPHNLTEIVNATIELVQDPHTPLSRIMELVPGPDFPTGAILLGRQGILDYFTRGRGSLKIRAKVSMEKFGKDRDAIIITELPYQVNKAKLVEQIAQLVNEKRLEGISDVRDESDRDGMRVVIELKRNEQTDIVLNNLYKLTQMQVSFGVILLSIVNGQPRELGIIDCLKRFIDHRVEVVRRRTEFLLRKAREREHLLLGFQKALQNLDAVIETVRASRNPREAREALMGQMEFPENLRLQEVVAKWSPTITFNGEAISRFDFSEKQAQAIIELQLQRLTGMEQQKILDELAEIQRLISGYLEILGSDKVLRGVIIKELKEVQKDFGDARRTAIVEDEGEISLEDLIKPEDVVVTVTRGGYLKRTSLDTYRRQTRGGKGRIGMATRTEDVVEHLMVANTHSFLLIFTSMGRLYWLKVYNIPDAGAASKGKNINGLISLQEDETVRTFLAVKEFTPDRFVVMATKHGVIKKCELTVFDNPMARGIIAIGLKDEDELISARISTGKDLIFIATHEGMAIKFDENDVRAMGRPAAGVTSMRLDLGDYIIGMEVVTEESLMLSVSDLGFGKRTKISEYRLQGRAGRGVINMKLTNKTGRVLAVLEVKEDTDVILITRDGKILRTEAESIRKTGRSASGVKLVSMEATDAVAAACAVQEAEQVEGEDDADNGQGDLPLQ
ncbi:DNA gyrase subunit A [Paludibaculum fermentans]|uniref:DNA gyrase subunit A n=1 Tax=Paludibaculum fermentans TaxID=1473598 RepID=A0A7S7NRW1_PALFE|nr:DNA gyrase subunit A [Paludibaculum fermentans]QOY88571.1 DNA gyrase subunit A [Paludibaculum fermentans]